MVVKGVVSGSDQTVRVTCPRCGEQHEELLVEIMNRKEAECPACGKRFAVEI